MSIKIIKIFIFRVCGIHQRYFFRKNVAYGIAYGGFQPPHLPLVRYGQIGIGMAADFAARFLMPNPENFEEVIIAQSFEYQLNEI